ncbi:hypothetical protein NX059_006967 [Plenodomus lindquistii]|nr:hypothetical protein NX059_006967 [Plenodomus lindquistii]
MQVRFKAREDPNGRGRKGSGRRMGGDGGRERGAYSDRHDVSAGRGACREEKGLEMQLACHDRVSSGPHSWSSNAPSRLDVGRHPASLSLRRLPPCAVSAAAIAPRLAVPSPFLAAIVHCSHTGCVIAEGVRLHRRTAHPSIVHTGARRTSSRSPQPYRRIWP